LVVVVESPCATFRKSVSGSPALIPAENGWASAAPPISSSNNKGFTHSDYEETAPCVSAALAACDSVPLLTSRLDEKGTPVPVERGLDVRHVKWVRGSFQNM